MENKASIDILLATYNGGKFLSEQLDSIFNQTFQDFQLIIRDDGSTDNTLHVIQQYQNKFPGRIILLVDDDKNLGAAQNFARLLQHCGADYMAFCDQDDTWMPEKLDVSLEKIQDLEKNFPGRPAVVYSDMQLIDENGKLLKASVWKQLNLSPEYFSFNRLLIQNIPHGCTMMFNRQMQELVSPIPDEAMLHDHWMALAASVLGKHAAIDKPLVRLRNHEQNVTRKQTSAGQKVERYVGNILSDGSYEAMVQKRVKQARAFKEKYDGQLSADQKNTLAQFLLLGSTSGLKRKWIYIKNGFFRTTLRHNLKMILRG